jgi:hypothetical protein
MHYFKFELVQIILGHAQFSNLSLKTLKFLILWIHLKIVQYATSPLTQTPGVHM